MENILNAIVKFNLGNINKGPISTFTENISFIRIIILMHICFNWFYSDLMWYFIL